MVRDSVRIAGKFSSSATITPPSTSPWPARYLVALWTTMLAPSSSGRTSIGVAKVLSTINGALARVRRSPRFYPARRRAAADSKSSP